MTVFKFLMFRQYRSPPAVLHGQKNLFGPEEVQPMSRLTIYRDNRQDSTVISNLFIDEYMKDPNDAQIKVYIYLLRMMDARQATSVSDIADKFNHTEKTCSVP